MKKFLTILCAAFAIFAVTSCGASVEDKAKEFAQKQNEALASGDFIKIAQLADEINKYEQSLSDSDKETFTLVYLQNLSEGNPMKAASKMMEAGSKAAADAMAAGSQAAADAMAAGSQAAADAMAAGSQAAADAMSGVQGDEE